MKLSEEDQKRVRRAQQAVTAYQDELATILPAQLARMRDCLAAGQRQDLTALAADLRDLSGTMGWTPLEEAGRHLVVAARSGQPDGAIEDILSAIGELGRSAHRTITPDHRTALRRISNLAGLKAG